MKRHGFPANPPRPQPDAHYCRGSHPLRPPEAMYDLAFQGNTVKLPFQFLHRLPQQFIGDVASVVELKRQEDFVPAANAHAAVVVSTGGTGAPTIWFSRRMRSYVAGPSTVKTIPSAAIGDSAASGTITSPVRQLLPEKWRRRKAR